MKVNNSRNKFILTRLITRILVVVTFTLTSLGTPLMADAMVFDQPMSCGQQATAIAAPQPTLAATQNQMQNNSKSAFEGSPNGRKGQVTYNRTKNAGPSEPSYGAINNTQRTLGTTENMSDRSTIKAKQKAKQDINRAENMAE